MDELQLHDLTNMLAAHAATSATYTSGTTESRTCSAGEAKGEASETRAGNRAKDAGQRQRHQKTHCVRRGEVKVRCASDSAVQLSALFPPDPQLDSSCLVSMRTAATHPTMRTRLRASLHQLCCQSQLHPRRRSPCES